MRIVIQWVLIRRPSLPKDFQAMTLLTEIVVGRENVQVFRHHKGKQESFYVVWLLNNVPVRVAQLGIMSSQIDGIISAWVEGSVAKEVKETFTVALECQYHLGNSFLSHWLDVGDDYLTAYQGVAIEEFEEYQLNIALDAFGVDMDTPREPLQHPDETATYDWFYGKSASAIIDTVVDDRPMDDRTDDDIEIGNTSAFTDEINKLLDNDDEDD